MSDITREKNCSKCNETKPADQFSRDRRRNDGLNRWCRECWKMHRDALNYEIDPTIKEKRCSKCKQHKPIQEFYPSRTSRDGLGSQCKSCDRERDRTRVYHDLDPAVSEKCCAKCQETKPVEQFHRHRTNRDGLDSYCKACRGEVSRAWYDRNKAKAIAAGREWAVKNPDRAKANWRKSALKRFYGMAPEDYDRLVEAQGGRCVCGSADDLHVDHDHDTGAVRGLLCGPCNRTIGMALESPERLLALVRYLERAKS